LGTDSQSVCRLRTIDDRRFQALVADSELVLTPGRSGPALQLGAEQAAVETRRHTSGVRAPELGKPRVMSDQSDVREHEREAGEPAKQAGDGDEGEGKPAPPGQPSQA
jgi:hypothetical protein